MEATKQLEILVGPVSGTEEEICTAAVELSSGRILGIAYGECGKYWLQDEYEAAGKCVAETGLVIAERRGPRDYVPIQETIQGALEIHSITE